ncbi:glycosyltransferase involved in cell wall biosynthesis [Cryobacterium sp. CAN_C3]|uniref:glycosyltransferase family 4 protein n=1 Tax=unclassified Cryobacterium TaxID=2649013 RepID=UPI0018C9BC92|nr:glycosyltransferase family 4 protein [Cryobacterium sp. CAN_C3]MEC5155819.1 glycosyltransferase involved in cell wall biosynthesis [Cryobacterium sp. CAN_C3]
MPELRVAIAYDCLFPLNTGGGERVYRRLAEIFVQRGGLVDYLTRRQWDAAAVSTATFSIVPVWRGDIYDGSGTRTPQSAVLFAFSLFRYFVRHRGQHDVVVVSALPVLNVFAVQLALLGTRVFIVSDWLEVWDWAKWRSYSGASVGTVAFMLQFFAIRLGHLHTVNSEFTGTRVRHYRRSAQPVTLGLVDLADDETDASTGRRTTPSLVFVGRHIADKRLIDLLPAFLLARDSIADLRLDIVGTGPETAAVAARITDLGLDGCVTLHGRVPEAELKQLISNARALVNPSEREGFGLVIAEAAALTTPSVVVAGPNNAAADLVVDGVNGFVAASIEPQILAAALVRAVEAGEPLRASTREWFARARVTSGLDRSVSEILLAYGSRRAR